MKKINIGVVLTRNEVKKESLKYLVGSKIQMQSCCGVDSCITLSGKTFQCVESFGKCWFEDLQCDPGGSECIPSAPCWCGAYGSNYWECS